MKPRALIGLVLLCVLLGGCTTMPSVVYRNDTFQGSSGPWHAKLHATELGAFYPSGGSLRYTNRIDGTFTLEYTGDPSTLTNVTTFGYTYETGASGGGMTESAPQGSYPVQKIYSNGFGSQNGSGLAGVTTVHVIVTINGVPIEFDLHK